jgi:hypothetical protein
LPLPGQRDGLGIDPPGDHQVFVESTQFTGPDIGDQGLIFRVVHPSAVGLDQLHRILGCAGHRPRLLTRVTRRCGL